MSLQSPKQTPCRSESCTTNPVRQSRASVCEPAPQNLQVTAVTTVFSKLQLTSQRSEHAPVKKGALCVMWLHDGTKKTGCAADFHEEYEKNKSKVFNVSKTREKCWLWITYWSNNHETTFSSSVRAKKTSTAVPCLPRGLRTKNNPQ